ncbi:MAG TPA: putative 2OG-Fe(II) oxygenase [Rhizomicrobium sp.]
MALAALGRPETAEANLRQALARQPGHVHALVMLARLLRKSGRGRELAALCGDIASRGVRHAQLLLESGRAAALTGDMAGARRLLLDHGRVARGAAPVPAPFADHAAFNAAFAEELLSNPVILDRFGTDDANRGSRRIHHLTGGRRPELVRALTTAIQAAIDRFVAALPAHGFDPWLEAVPRLARLNSWGLIQRSGEYEAWHLHRGGWLSGVYYVQLPAAFSVAGEGAGCIEFGAPPSLATAGLAPSPPLRIAPQAGMLLLAPSHYHHRTIPFAAPGYRLSFAFDVVPLDNL